MADGKATIDAQSRQVEGDGSDSSGSSGCKPAASGGGHEAHGSGFSGGEGRVVFTRTVADKEEAPKREIFTVGPQGQNPRRITNNSFREQDVAGFSGPEIAFSTGPADDHGYIRDIDAEVWVVNRETGQTTQLTTSSDDYGYTDPAWSPDGTRIAFVRSGRYDSDISVMNADGTRKRNLTPDFGEDEAYPDWSPDGTKIVFSSSASDSATSDIYTMNADGSGVERITETVDNGELYEVEPDWSPDSSEIAFWGYTVSSNDPPRDWDFEVYKMNADGSGVEQLTRNYGTSDSSPVWSPDGRKIAYDKIIQQGSSSSNVYTMNADGTGEKDLTSTTNAYENDPDWLPRRTNSQ